MDIYLYECVNKKNQQTELSKTVSKHSILKLIDTEKSRI